MKERGTSIMLQEMKVMQGKNVSQIARETGMSRITVRKYLEQGEQPHRLKGKIRGSKLDPFKPYIQELLELGVYNASVIFDRIIERGFDGGITILKDYLAPFRPPSVKMEPAVRRFETPPGRQAQMDWGFMNYKARNGQMRKVACFVMVLGHSRTRYIEFSRRCDSASLLRCMLNAFEYFGGVPEVVLTDRMKTVIISTDHGKPIWHEPFERFATDMRFIPKVCRPRRPQTKGKVERLVHYVRDNFLPGRAFIDFGDLQLQAVAWCDQANQKVHGTTGERPVDLLLAEKLSALPPENICKPYRMENRKVSREGFVSYNGALYGVHWRNSGKCVQVALQRGQIIILDEAGQLLQTHAVCHKSRKHVYATGQYDGLSAQQGIPHEPSCAVQIPLDQVYIRPLTEYAQFAEAT
jgi:transposase